MAGPFVNGSYRKLKYAPKVDSQQILTSRVGKNTHGRKDDIGENIFVTVEQ